VRGAPDPVPPDGARGTWGHGLVQSRVIGYLQRAVNHEFSAAQQYTLQAASAARWGMGDLAEKLRGDAREELEHAEAFLDHMLGQGVTLRVGNTRTPQIGNTRAEVLKFGMETEAAAVRLYREAAAYCRQIGDTAGAELFTRILRDEERHFDELARETGAA